MATNTPVNGGTDSGGGVAGVSSVNTRAGDVTLSKTDVGLSNVDNTTDLLKPISTATQSALDGKEATGAAASAVAAHVALSDPHSQYMTVSEADAATSSAIGTHVAASNPHSQYLKIADVVAAPVQSVAGRTGAVTLTKADIPNFEVLAAPSVSTSLTLGPSADIFQNTEGNFGWRDNIAQFVVRGSGAADPSFGALFNGLEGYLFSATTLQRVFCDFHIDHDIARGTVLYPHVHWMPTTTATGVVRWGIEYSVAKGHQQGAASTFPATTTVYVNQTISAPSQWQHFVAEVSLADAIPSTNIEPDSVIKVRVFRDAANAADTYNGAVHAWQCDLHYQASRFATLNKAPNFYA